MQLPPECRNKLGLCDRVAGKGLINFCPVCCRQGEIQVKSIETENIAVC